METLNGGRRGEIDPAKWHRLKTIVADALEQTSPATRAAFVEERCEGDSTLWRDAESLLAAADALNAEETDSLEECAEHATARLWDEDTLVGSRLGPYLIVRELGRGGMGAVYLGARADGQFEKQVAVKVLKRGTDTDEILRRFAVERQILARLEHPHIARLLDAGTTNRGLPYFVMEYVDGVPVNHFMRDGSLSVPDRLGLFLKICSAVELAHRAHIIHRDLKPSNILVNAEGEPKLLDFGIAKLLEPDERPAELTAAFQQHLTPGSASPEQTRGERVTAASDVYALGALLYEMLTNCKPYHFTSTRPSRQEVQEVVGHEEPGLPSMVAASAETRAQLRGDVDDIVLYAMRKEPELRYQSVAAFSADIKAHLDGGLVQARPASTLYRFQRFLARNQLFKPRSLALAAVLLLLGGGIAALLLGGLNLGSVALHVGKSQDLSPVPPKSIAVLPFENLSGESENAFFATGVQDAILADLGKVADLKVISRTSVAKYTSDRPRDVREISRQLGVAHLLEGSVQRAGNRVRVTTTLINARSDAQVWAETYDRDLADVFAIQSEIAQTIVGQLQARLLPREKAEIELPPTRDLAAYDLYLQAKDIVDGYLDATDPKASLLQAIRLLEEATRRDPNFTVAYCYGARAHSIIWGLGLDPNGSRFEASGAALRVAFKLQPDSAEAHLAMAESYYRFGLDLDLAEKELALAGPGLPNSAPFYTLAGNVYRRQARWEEAERILEKAVELDPRNTNAINFLADTQILMRKFREARSTYERGRAAGLDTPILSVRIAIVDFAVTGRTQQLEAALAAGPAELDVAGGETPLRVLIALQKRDYEAAWRALAASPRNDFQDVDFSFYYPRSWYQAAIARAQGDAGKTQRAFTDARHHLEQRLKRMPQHARTKAVVAQVYAGLGLEEMAVGLAVEATEPQPRLSSTGRTLRALDAYDGPLVRQGLAQVYTWTGQKDRALEILESLLKEPGYLCYGYLLADPAWDPLRAEPRFQELLTSLAPDASTR